MAEYFFDKRKIKKYLIKYSIIFLCCIPIMIVLGYLIQDKINQWLVVLINAGMVLFIIAIVEIIEYHLNKRKNKPNDKIVKKYKKGN